jgi:hypothetical protein
MAIEWASGNSSLIDVLDRVLDKGIVNDASVRVSLVGIDLVTVEARVVVASIATYLQHSETMSRMWPVLNLAAFDRKTTRVGRRLPRRTTRHSPAVVATPAPAPTLSRQ